MGNIYSSSNSRSQNSSNAREKDRNAPKCYYELLEVSQDATFDELKRAYRQKALKLHPDKNLHRLEEAHHDFSAVRAAYEVLSDPQERTWYDRHRSAILSQKKRATEVDDAPSLDDLLKYFSEDVYDGYHDGPQGFFTIYRELFEFLEEFETEGLGFRARSQGSRSHAASTSSFTSFGSERVPYEPMVRQFYDKWLHFTSNRTFDEQDKYQSTFSENRRIRRAMHKENCKERERLRREFSETVRELTAFVRKRDPRYVDFRHQRNEQRRKEEAEKKAQERTRREEETANYVEQDWTKVDDDQFERAYDEVDGDKSEVDDEGEGMELKLELEEFYCAPCKKLFKNRLQWKNHAKSKKHRTKLISLGINEFDSCDDENMNLNTRAVQGKEHEFGGGQVEDNVQVGIEGFPTDGHDSSSTTKSVDDSAEELIDSISSLHLETKAARQEDKQTPISRTMARKSRRAKMKTKSVQSAVDQSSHRCNTCNAEFESRNRLFKHVKEEGHALAATPRHFK